MRGAAASWRELYWLRSGRRTFYALNVVATPLWGMMFGGFVGAMAVNMVLCRNENR